MRGLSTREALRRLDADPAVELIVVVSKPPADDVAAEIRDVRRGPGHPGRVRAARARPARPDRRGRGGAAPARPRRPDLAGRRRARSAPVDGDGLLRGLFVGGTLATRRLIVATELLGADGGHTFVDFGDDAYTAGRAHPMIDPTLRLEHLARAAADPTTGVMLLDVVLGHGAEPDPAALLAPAIAGDRASRWWSPSSAPPPTRRASTGRCAALADAGAEVHLSNAGATRRAVELLGGRA